MMFLKKDTAPKAIIEAIDAEFKKILETIMVVNLYLINNPKNETMRNFNEGVFQMERVENEHSISLTYTPLARINILPLLGDLELIVTGKKHDRKRVPFLFNNLYDTVIDKMLY